MTENPASTGFTRGFFGCFGVLAAIVAGAFALVIVSQVWSAGKAKAVMAGTADLTGANNPCINAMAMALHRYPGFEDLDPSAPPTAIPLGGLRYECRLDTARQVRRLKLTIVCGDLTQPDCVRLSAPEVRRLPRLKR